jgi:hypothetical protein
VDAVAPPPEGGDRAQPSDGEQVDQHQPAGRSQHPGDLGQAGRLVAPVRERDRAHHQVEAGIRERQPLGDRLGQPHLPVPQPTSSTAAGWGSAASATSVAAATTGAWNCERQSRS